jgi:hypothetical protein
MKALTLLALFLLVAEIYAQTQPVPYQVLSRTITTTQTNTFLVNQLLPACYEVDYLVSDITSISEGDLYTVLYVPQTNGSIPAPSAPVSIQFYYGSNTKPQTPIQISSVIDQTYNNIPYLSQGGGCPIQIDGVTVLRSPGNPGSGCGLNYYCSGFKNISSERLWVRIITTDAENAQGIIFNLAVQKSNIPISQLTLNQVLTTTTQPPQGNSLFKPTVAQKHYKITIGASGSSNIAIANFLTLANPANELLFTLTNVKVNGVVQTLGTNLGEWSLTINLNDIAHADDPGLLVTDPSQPCIFANDVDPSFYVSNNTLAVQLGGCSVLSGTYYIAVGLPQSFATSYTYDLLVQIQPLNIHRYTPTYTTLTNGVYINDVLGYYTQADLELQNIYLLNIAPSNFPAASYFFVTVFGVDYGSVSLQVTQDCFGFGSDCGGCLLLAECNTFTAGSAPSPDVARDYCKVKVQPCTANPNLPYFVTIRANVDQGYTYIQYSLQFNIETVTPVDITTLPSVTNPDGYTDYYFSGFVAEQDYDHFYYKIDTTVVTPLYHLSAQLYTKAGVEEAIFAHNPNSLAGSAPFYFSYAPNTGHTQNFYQLFPADTCYKYDWACNTAYKNLDSYKLEHGFNGFEYYGSCAVVLPYCELVNASVHYFSVYGVNSSPNSYWGPDYAHGIGYNRSIEYTLVFRLWSQAQVLTSGEVTNGFVYQDSEFYYDNTLPTYDVLGESFLNNWYSHQYVYTVPNDGNLYDSIRVVLGDVQQTYTTDHLTLFVSCGFAAGECPCFSNFDFACIAKSDPYHTSFNYGERFCEVYVPLCECNGQIYLSVRSYLPDFAYEPDTFNLAVFPQVTQKISSLHLPSSAVQVDDYFAPSNYFAPFFFNQFSLEFYLLERFGVPNLFTENVLIYDSALYNLTVTSIAANHGLEFTVRFIHTPGKFDFLQLIFLSIGENTIPPSNPFAANCSRSCIAVTEGGSNGSDEGWAYCTILLDPCEVNIGSTLYVRLTGAVAIGHYSSSFYTSFAGVGYTLTVANVNDNPVALTLGSHYPDYLYQSEYNHYSIALPSTQAGLRIRLFRNFDQTDPLVFYLNTNGSLAGDAPCFSYTDYCELYDLETSVCEFFIPICEYAAIAGKTVYLSVRNRNENPNNLISKYLEYFPQRSYVAGDHAIEFTIFAQLEIIQVLSLTPGSTVTENIYDGQNVYFSASYSQTDVTAGKILTIELESIEPERYYNDAVVLITAVSTTSPAAITAGECPCSNIFTYYYNDFRQVLYPCDLNGRAGTYYFTVKALINGFGSPNNPVSFTFKMFWTVPITQTLSLSTTYQAAPHPLNFNESVVYTIAATTNNNQIIEVEIADLPSTVNSLYARGVIAYLNYGVPGSASCNIDSCSPINLQTSPVPSGTVMCRFTITPCTECTGNYYVTVNANLLAPEPRIQFRSNYTIRAYTRTIGTLDGFPSNYRGNATQPNGYTFTINNVATPTISCDNRWGTNVYYDYFYQLPALTVNQYELFDVSSLGSNDANLQISFESGVSPDRNGICGCDVAPGGICEFTDGCFSAASKAITVFGRVGYDGCTGTSINGSANGVAFNAQVFTDRVYTSIPSIKASVNVPVVATLKAGQYVVINFQPSSAINFFLLPEITYNIDLSLSGGTVTDRTCYNNGIGNSVSATTFPGDSADGSSYCNVCSPMTSSSISFDGCCFDPNEQLYLTVYNPPNSGVSSFNFTFTVNVVNAAQNYSALTLPISQTYSSINPNFATAFSFFLQPNQLNYDDVLYVKINAVNGTVNAYFNFAYYAHSQNFQCSGSFFTCTTDNQNCVLQLPACYFSTVTPGAYLQYFVSLEAQNQQFVGPVTVSITVQRTTVLTFPTGSSGTSGSVPDLASTPVDYQNNYKFQYTRSVGDYLLNDNNVALKVVLTPSSTANNSLVLHISDPIFSSSGNPLAGPTLSSNNPTPSSCAYNDDTNWQCYASNALGSTQTRTTVGNVGVTCFLYFCTNGISQAEIETLLSNQYIYLSVQNVDQSSGRVPTSYSLSVGTSSTPLLNTEVQFTITPSHSSTDGNITTSACVSSGTITGGCQYRVSNYSTAYFQINLSGINSWGINDYLLVNFTGISTPITITSWSSDQCEPPSSIVDLTCNPGDKCILDSDPCSFTSLFRSDNGANSFVVNARNIYLRVQGLTSNTAFNIAVSQVTPLQITVPLTNNSPFYSQIFQSWEARWTMFNFILPKNQVQSFLLNIEVDCGATSPPEVYLNEYDYQWASKDCTEVLTRTLPFSWEHESCETGGNFFVSVYTPLNSLEFLPIAIPEGNISPQIKFTITAQIVNSTNYNSYPWESVVSLPHSGVYNFIALGDNENFGTGISVQLNSQADVGLQIISPLVRETYANTTATFVTPLGDFYTAFLFAEPSPCDIPACDQVGVYCCSLAKDCILNIPPCEYRNGRYFIITSVTAPSVLSSRVYRQDYTTLTLSPSNNYIATDSGTLPLGPIVGSNINLNYYQFYQIILTGNPYFLNIEVSSNLLELIQSAGYLSPQDYLYYSLAYTPLIRASLRRGDTGLSTSSDNGGSTTCQEGGCPDCSTIYCSTFTPGTCVFGEVQCTASTYFLGIWFQHNEHTPYLDCDLLRYDLYVSAQNVAPITISPLQTVCGTLQGTTANFTNPAHESYNYGGKKRASSLYSDVFNSYIVDDEDDGPYPSSNTYSVVLSGIDTNTAGFAIVLTVFPQYTDQDLTLSVSTIRPASTVCNDCSKSTSIVNSEYEVVIYLNCGGFNQLWITVSTVFPNYLEIDYSLYVNVLNYAVITPTIPTLTFGVPAVVSFSVTNPDSLVKFSTNNFSQALVRGNNFISTDSTYQSDCISGCPAVEPGCLFLGSHNNYYVYFYETFTTATCFETPITSFTESIEVQSVHVLNIPASGFTNFTSTLQFGGYDLVYIPLPTFTVNSGSLFFFQPNNIQSGVVVQGSCEGYTAGATCGNKVLFSFDDTNTASIDVQSLCNCNALFLTIFQNKDACGSQTTYTLSVEVINYVQPNPTVKLTPPNYIADALVAFGHPFTYNVYTVTATADGFVHSSINLVNNTAGPNFHSIEAYLYDSYYCELDSCITGVYDHESLPARDSNDQDKSCYLYSSANNNELYYIVVQPLEAIADPAASAADYRINAIVSYTDLETTASSRFQLIGFDRHYYKVNGRVGGVQSGQTQSVVITMNIVDGDRLAIIVADHPSYINYFNNLNTANYNGWARSKVCYFGECTIELSTRATHPGSALFYVWVETVSTTTIADYRLEKPTNYLISATTGLNNCESTSSFITGFCATTVQTLSKVYAYRDVNLRNEEAQARFNNFLCRCNPPTATCLSELTRFSCLESFRECDSGGFWLPICRAECNNVEAACGPFEESDGTCQCSFPEFACTNPRYSDAGSGLCTGTQPSIVPTPSIAPSSSNKPSGQSASIQPSLSHGASHSRTPTHSSSHIAGHSNSRTPTHHASASRTPTPNNGAYTVIKYYFIYYQNSPASALSANVYLAMFALILSVFFF